jgi:hypothetical protein
MEWMNNDQILSIVLGALLAISELLGSVKRGPNGILHAVWKFYNLKVELEYDEDGEHEVEEAQRVIDQNLSSRETIVPEGGVDGVLLVK